MSTKIDWEKYETPKKSTKTFDFEKYEKKQEPVSLKGAVGSYGTGIAGGAGGIGGDILNLLKSVPGLQGMLTQAALNNTNIQSTPELTKSIAQEYNTPEPQNALERILQKGGEFGGQEATIGAGLGGPVGAGAGLAHGTASGLLYGGLKELGTDENTALVLTTLATVSPIAFQKLLPSIKNMFKSAPKGAIESIEKATESIHSSLPPSEPPGPPGSPFTDSRAIKPGTLIPETVNQFEEKEKIIKQLVEPTKGHPLGVEVKIGEEGKKVSPLSGRVSTAQELGDVITKNPFHSEAQATREISNDVKKARDAERAVVREKYKKAEEITQTHNDIYPELAAENDKRISSLEDIQKRSAGEQAVYEDALALRKMIGTSEGLIEENAGRLMKQANSFSQKINYELPYQGYKAGIKDIVHQINKSVLASLEKAGKNSSAVREADKTYSRFADRFMGQEIDPFLRKNILDQEKLARDAVSDEATYRAIKNALGSRKGDLINKLDRELIHERMDKYYKDPEAINSKQYQKDLSNLAERIGKEKIAEVDHFLQKRLENYERKKLGERKLKETQLSREKIPANEKAPAIAEKMQTKGLPQIPEDIDRALNTQSGIRRLKKQMKDKGLSKEFDKLVEKKVEEIFKEGGFGSKKVTGEDLKRIIDKDHEILTEFLGKEEVSALYRVASEAAKKELTNEIVKEVALKAGTMGLNMIGLGKILKLLPIKRL